MIIVLNIPISSLELIRIDLKEINTTVSDVKNICISAIKDQIAATARATINIVGIKQELNISITLQFQVESGKLVCQDVSAKADNFIATAIVKTFENRILNVFNSSIKKGLDKIFIHYLDIGDDIISISCSLQEE